MNSPIKEKFIIEACAMLAYLNNEDGSTIIEEILQRGQRQEAEIFITAMDLAEICHIIRNEEGKERALKVMVLVKTLPVQLVVLDESLIMTVGEIRMKYPLTLGDALVAAVAKSRGAKIITGDHDFKKLEKELDIIWI